MIGLHPNPVLPKDSRMNSFRRLHWNALHILIPRQVKHISSKSLGLGIYVTSALLTTICLNYPLLRLSLPLVSVSHEGLGFALHIPVPQYTGHVRDKCRLSKFYHLAQRPGESAFKFSAWKRPQLFFLRKSLDILPDIILEVLNIQLLVLRASLGLVQGKLSLSKEGGKYWIAVHTGGCKLYSNQGEHTGDEG